MLQLKQARLERSAKTLFEGASFMIHPGFKVVLVGANGAGKSTFLQLLEGQIELSEGELELPASWKLAKLSQEITDLDSSALEYMLKSDPEWYRHHLALKANSSEQAVLEASQYMSEHLGFDYEAKAAKILNGLGFAQEDLIKPVRSFSGGWQMRLNLGRTLFSPSDLVLLDEPTNHLDLEAILWLEAFIRASAKTVVCVSHDRRFMDAFATHTLMLTNASLNLFKGNFSLVEEQVAQQASQEAKQQEQLERRAKELSRFVERFRAKATKAKQAQSRAKQLEKLVHRIKTPLPEAEAASFYFECEPLGSACLSAKDAKVGYTQSLVSVADLHVASDERLGLLGANGSGKTTLIKALCSDTARLNGTFSSHPKLNLGWFSQNAVTEALDMQLSALENLQREFKQRSVSQLRDHLGALGFSGDDQLRAVSGFSSGQRARLVLGMISLKRPNLLVLDEPTNHLDLTTKSALAEALAGFQGALIIISHDREFLELTCERFLRIKDKHLVEFDQPLDQYSAADSVTAQTSVLTSPAQDHFKPQNQAHNHAQNQAQNQAQSHLSNQAQAVNHTSTATANKAEERKAAAKLRLALAPFKKKLEQAEQTLEALVNKQTSLIEALADPKLYTEEANKAELQTLLEQEVSLKLQVDAAELEVLECMDQLEEAQSSA